MSRRRKPVASGRSERGAAAVEFGLISIALLTLLIGIIQFALFFWSYEVGSHSAREGARLAAVAPCDEAAIEARVIERVGGASPDVTPSVTVVPSASPIKVGDSVKVSVSMASFDIGFFPGFSGAFTKSATARVENVPAGGC